jgi:6-phosphogluconate dehydrogenase
VLSSVVDKVVQDADDTEGTGAWTVIEASRIHISAPTIVASHFLRLASADRAARLEIGCNLQLPSPPVSPKAALERDEKNKMLEDIRHALYAAFIASFAQGFQLIARQNAQRNWGVSLSTCLQIWRAGCIISSDGLSEVFKDVVADFDRGSSQASSSTSGSESSHPKDAAATIPAHPRVTGPLASTMPSLRRTVLWGLARDAYIPTLSQSLEWVKYVGAPLLPTMFMEAELDWFGMHKFDKWNSVSGRTGGQVKKGAEHYEWSPA